MDVKAFPALIVGVVVALVLFGATLPAWGDINDDMTTTYTNSQGVRASMANLNETHTYSISGTTFTVDGETVNIPNYAIVLSSDKFNARKFTTSFDVKCSQGSGASLSITVSDGKFTGTIGTYTYTDEPLSYLAVYNTTGAYTMMVSDSNARTIYLNDPTEQYYSANWISTTSEWFSYYNGVLTVGGQVNDTMTFTGEQLDYDTSVYRYTTSQDDIIFKVDNNGEDYTVHPYICVVPYEVHGMATQTNHIVATLLSILPLLIGAGLVLGAVAWFIARKG